MIFSYGKLHVVGERKMIKTGKLLLNKAKARSKSTYVPNHLIQNDFGATVGSDGVLASNFIREVR